MSECMSECMGECMSVCASIIAIHIVSQFLNHQLTSISALFQLLVHFVNFNFI